jgi:hypothetical protein
MDSGNLAEWVSGVATAAAVVVALFQNPIRGYWSRPKLRASFRLSSPDCDKSKLRIPIAWEEPYGHQPVVDGYYFRLWIENEGKTRAEQVQVFAAELYKEALDESLHRVDDFLPQNFTWSHLRNDSAEVFAEGLSQQMGRHCDFGLIVVPGSAAAFGIAVNAGKNECKLSLKLESGLYHLDKGSYRLKIRVAAANCAPIEYTVRIRFEGRWYDDARTMFADGIGVSIPS